jgi:hypothetical protein
MAAGWHVARNNTSVYRHCDRHADWEWFWLGSFNADRLAYRVLKP